MTTLFRGDWDEIYLSYGGYITILLANIVEYIRINFKKNCNNRKRDTKSN